MLTAQLYGETINGKTITEIKRKASRIANKYCNTIDRMEVTDQDRNIKCTFRRFNRKYPNNTIEFSQWQ